MRRARTRFLRHGQGVPARGLVLAMGALALLLSACAVDRVDPASRARTMEVAQGLSPVVVVLDQEKGCAYYDAFKCGEEMVDLCRRSYALRVDFLRVMAFGPRGHPVAKIVKRFGDGPDAGDDGDLVHRVHEKAVVVKVGLPPETTRYWVDVHGRREHHEVGCDRTRIQPLERQTFHGEYDFGSKEARILVDAKGRLP